MRILIADDYEGVRSGIRTVLEARPEWEVCGEAVNGEDAVRLAGELLPDVIIMDINMPVMSGLEATEQLNKHGCDTKVLIFTMNESQSLPEAVRRVGASGYVLKSQAARDLINALDRVHGGGTFFDDGAKKADGQEPIRVMARAIL
jgi:DNA-binding NarL/FixJ family response regulator